ncbi:hypothetical protein THIOM_004044, partial [Candidatus Thiomargarita nelsonii]
MLIVCNGMLRSGSTLQYNLLKSIVESHNLGGAEGYFSSEQFQSLRKKFERWGISSEIIVIKTHDIIPYSEEMIKSGTMKICYTYRDIRDVAVSAQRKFDLDGDKLLKSLDR